MSNNKQQPKPENPNNQFSNTEPLTHAQRVAIANKMSNNKQSSVEWLSEIIRFANKELYAEMFDEIEQAKAMHYKEIVTAHSTGLPIEDGVFTAIDKGHKYYDKTFGGNNEQQ